MNLKPIALQEDKSNETYASADCQQLLSMYDDFYPKICFNIPWVGYFVVSHTGFTRGINNLTINFVVKTIEQRVKR